MHEACDSEQRLHEEGTGQPVLSGLRPRAAMGLGASWGKQTVEREQGLVKSPTSPLSLDPCSSRRS